MNIIFELFFWNKNTSVRASDMLWTGALAYGPGGARGAAAPAKLWVTQVFLAGREIWAKPVFKAVFIF